MEGLFEDSRDVLDASDQVVVLRHRRAAADHVRLLEGVPAHDRGVDLAGDRDQRDRVHEGGGEARDHVQRAGAGGRHHHPRLAAGSGVAVRHVGAALLVAHQDVPQLGMAGQVLVDGQVGPARVAEYELDSLPLEGFEDHVRSGHLGCSFL